MVERMLPGMLWLASLVLPPGLALPLPVPPKGINDIKPQKCKNMMKDTVLRPEMVGGAVMPEPGASGGSLSNKDQYGLAFDKGVLTGNGFMALNSKDNPCSVGMPKRAKSNPGMGNYWPLYADGPPIGWGDYKDKEEKKKTSLPSARLTTHAPAGSTKLEVNNLAGWKVGTMLRMDPGEKNEEDVELAGFGSLLLAAPTKYPHGPGSVIRQLSAEESSAPTKSGVVEADEENWTPEPKTTIDRVLLQVNLALSGSNTSFIGEKKTSFLKGMATFIGLAPDRVSLLYVVSTPPRLFPSFVQVGEEDFPAPPSDEERGGLMREHEEESAAEQQPESDLLSLASVSIGDVAGCKKNAIYVGVGFLEDSESPMKMADVKKKLEDAKLEKLGRTLGVKLCKTPVVVQSMPPDPESVIDFVGNASTPEGPKSPLGKPVKAQLQVVVKGELWEFTEQKQEEILNKMTGVDGSASGVDDKASVGGISLHKLQGVESGGVLAGPEKGTVAMNILLTEMKNNSNPNDPSTICFNCGDYPSAVQVASSVMAMGDQELSKLIKEEVVGLNLVVTPDFKNMTVEGGDATLASRAGLQLVNGAVDQPDAPVDEPQLETETQQQPGIPEEDKEGSAGDTWQASAVDTAEAVDNTPRNPKHKAWLLQEVATDSEGEAILPAKATLPVPKEETMSYAMGKGEGVGTAGFGDVATDMHGL